MRTVPCYTRKVIIWNDGSGDFRPDGGFDFIPDFTGNRTGRKEMLKIFLRGDQGVSVGAKVATHAVPVIVPMIMARGQVAKIDSV